VQVELAIVGSPLDRHGQASTGTIVQLQRYVPGPTRY
jgi:hypothetical protein